MGKKKRKKQQKKRDARKRAKVWVCRGCCCGTAEKHPGVDHDVLLATLRAGAKAGGAKLAVSDCVGPCGQGNIVVVRAGGDICWFRKMNGLAETAALADLVAAGGSLRRLPKVLARRTIPKRAGKKPKP